LSEKLDFKHTQKLEKRIFKIVSKLFLPLIVLMLTIALFVYDFRNLIGSNGKTKLFLFAFIYIQDNIHPLIIGLLGGGLFVFMVRNIYLRFKEPRNDNIFSKK